MFLQGIAEHFGMDQPTGMNMVVDGTVPKVSHMI